MWEGEGMEVMCFERVRERTGTVGAGGALVFTAATRKGSAARGGADWVMMAAKLRYRLLGW